MRKKIMYCNVCHKDTLHRCKRIYRQKQKSGKEGGTFWSEYSEKCFLCISKGFGKQTIQAPIKKARHVRI